MVWHNTYCLFKVPMYLTIFMVHILVDGDLDDANSLVSLRGNISGSAVGLLLNLKKNTVVKIGAKPSCQEFSQYVAYITE